MANENYREDEIIARLSPLMEWGARERVICIQLRKVVEVPKDIKR
jgi:hypothetical protein